MRSCPDTDIDPTVLILEVCRTPVTYELSLMTLLSMSSRSSVKRAPARCSGGHGFESCQELRCFLCPMLVACTLIHLSHLLQSTKFTIFIHLSLHVHLLVLSDKTNNSVTLYVCDLVDLLLILGRSTGAEALKKKSVVTHDQLKDLGFVL